MIQADDMRMLRPPDGWELAGDDPLELEDVLVWECRRVA